MNHDEFLERLTVEYPKTAKENDVRSLVIPSLIAPVALQLPEQWRDEAQTLVSLFFNRLRSNEAEAERLRKLKPELSDPGHTSVLMSYDFHVDFSKNPKGRLRLIEINTNASMSLLTDVMNCQQHLFRCVKEEFLDDFMSELGQDLRNKRIAIVDDEPTKQKLYIEFLMYKELFENRGAQVQIVDRKALTTRGGKLWCDTFGPIDLVYNRSTDFFFEEEASKALREVMGAKTCVITPHPHEYRLLADKNRLIEWTADGALERLGLNQADCDILRRCLIRSRSVAELDPESLWAERKSLIFKPKSSFGGKAVFRGASISRAPFQTIIESKGAAGGFIAQDFVPAPSLKIGDQDFKYDLRFFAYRDKVHIACGRLYQGQITNATTPGGGVAAIQWADVETPQILA